MQKRFFCLMILLLSLNAAFAQRCTLEPEPNNTPENATLFVGMGCFNGTLSSNEQDFFRWELSEQDLNGRRVLLELSGLPDTPTRLDLLRLDVNEAGETTERHELLTLSTGTGAAVTTEPLLLTPGSYSFIVSQSGGEGAYQVALGLLEPRLPRSSGAPAREEAREEMGSLNVVGDLRPGEGAAYFLWTLEEAAALQRWTLRAQPEVGQPLTLKLFRSDGELLMNESVRAGERLERVNLAFKPGTYTLVLSSDAETRFHLETRSEGVWSAGEEREPNNREDEATLFEIDTGISGTLMVGEQDWFRFRIEEGGFYTLETGLAGNATFELFDDAGQRLIYRRGEVARLENHLLEAGLYTLKLSASREDLPYSLRFSAGEAPAEGYKLEPNDSAAYAMPLAETLSVRGTMIAREEDHFLFEVTQPELYRVQVLGENLRTISLYDEGGTQVLSHSVNDRRTRLDNLLLLPGRYTLVLDGEQSEYSLRLLSLGPAVQGAQEAAPGTLAPEGEQERPADETEGADIAVSLPRPAGVLEREPNNDATRAETLQVAEVRVGTMPTANDHDLYRFSLANSAYVRIEATPPEDGAVSFDLSGQARTLQREDTGTARADLWLLAGDYIVTLRPETPSDGYYQLELSLLEALVLPADLEPNNAAWQARPLPPSLTVSGHVGEYRGDDDWYALPTFDEEATVRFHLSGDSHSRYTLHERESGATLERFEYNPARESEAPDITLSAAQAYDLRVSGNGHYTFRLEPLNLTQEAAAPPAHDPGTGNMVTLSLDLDVSTVAAYATHAQTLGGTLTLHNEGAAAQTIRLEQHRSDPKLELTGLPERMALAAGEKRTLELDLLLAPDVWDTASIVLTLGNGQFSTSSSLTATCEAPAVASRLYWPLPESLLGGTNVAAAAFGASVLEGEGSSNRDPQLLNERISAAQGSHREAGESLYIALAGEEVLSLQALLLHPHAYLGVGDQLRDFELLSSLDGENYELVLRGSLSPVRQEQVFTLPEGTEARYVALRFLTKQSGEPRGRITLGTLKLIGNYPLRALNIADPRYGGHVVWSDPLTSPGGVLSEVSEGESGSRTTVRLGESQEELSWVVSFRHNRAALIGRLEWRDHDRSRPQERLQEITVDVSLDSPTGPWQPLTVWQLERLPAAEGEIPEVSALELATPVWARYLRFRAEGLSPRGTYNLPETLRVIEGDRAGYRSILGEWGHERQQASYEHLEPVTLSTLENHMTAGISRNDARLLASGETVGGTVSLDTNDAWFRLEVPEGQNQLELTLRGDPALRYRLENAGGERITTHELTQAGARQLVADVTPGRYYLKLEEPPRSVIFLWDNSGSMGPYAALTYSALMRFAQDIEPEREEVGLGVFAGSNAYFLLPQLTGEPQEVMRALSQYDRRHGSSNAEPALLASSEALRGRDGTRAMLLITDAESGGYNQTTELWRSLAEVQPRIFSFEVSSSGNALPQRLMQSWAAAAAGDYRSINNLSELEVGFARAACLLRRPKLYEVSVETRQVTRDPGRLEVVWQTEENPDSHVSSSGTAPALAVILDASGSMYRRLGERFRYEIANDVLLDLVQNTLEPGMPFALRVFGNREERSCRTDLEVPLGPLEPETVSRLIRSVTPQAFSGTPIAASLQAIAGDLSAASGSSTVVLITDGEESCDGDVEAAIDALRAEGLEVVLNIIGFDYDAEDREVARETFRRWAALGGGNYYDATSAEELAASLTQAVSLPALPFRVLAADGETIASGTVTGAGLELPEGSYRVQLEDRNYPVEIRAAQTVRLELPYAPAGQ